MNAPTAAGRPRVVLAAELPDLPPRRVDEAVGDLRDGLDDAHEHPDRVAAAAPGLRRAHRPADSGAALALAVDQAASATA